MVLIGYNSGYVVGDKLFVLRTIHKHAFSLDGVVSLIIPIRSLVKDVADNYS